LNKKYNYFIDSLPGGEGERARVAVLAFLVVAVTDY